MLELWKRLAFRVFSFPSKLEPEPILQMDQLRNTVDGSEELSRIKSSPAAWARKELIRAGTNRSMFRWI